MSEHLASMNEQVTAQNDKIDRLQQQLHINPKVTISKIVSFKFIFVNRTQKKAKNEIISIRLCLVLSFFLFSSGT
jgi:hypothetical protein